MWLFAGVGAGAGVGVGVHAPMLSLQEVQRDQPPVTRVALGPRVEGHGPDEQPAQDKVGSSTSLMPWTTTWSVWMTLILLLTT